MATIMYEGLPTRPDAGIWWSLVEKYKVTAMFSAPTAVRVLKKQDPAYLSKYDLSSLRALFLAGEPLDEPTAKWIAEALGKPIIDNYWQTETRLADPDHRQRRGEGAQQVRLAGRADVRLRRQAARREHRRGAARRRREGRGHDRRPAAAGLHADRVAATTRASSRPTGAPSAASRSTAPSTGACATPTATTSSSAAPTTSSTSPATAWARARSRRASPATPTWPRWRWSAWPTT